MNDPEPHRASLNQLVDFRWRLWESLIHGPPLPGTLSTHSAGQARKDSDIRLKIEVQVVMLIRFIIGEIFKVFSS
jgi:hypothetical protein